MDNDKPFNWKDFEKIITYLLEAEHDIKINCVINGDTRERQFDG